MLARKYMILFLALMPLISLGQTEEKPKYAPRKEKHRNKTDEFGQKQGVWKQFNAMCEITQEIEYMNNKRHGMSKRYYPYAKIMDETEYFSGVKEGVYRRYYYSGSIRIEGEYLGGKKNGRWTKYYDDGEVSLEGDYKFGLKEGEWRAYNRRGALTNSVVYKDGVDLKAAQAAKDADDKKKADEAARKAALEAQKNPNAVQQKTDITPKDNSNGQQEEENTEENN